MKRPARIPRFVAPIPDKDAHRKAPDHLALVAKIGFCCVPGCNRTDIHYHHLMKPDGKFRGHMKSADRYVVNICGHHHMFGGKDCVHSAEAAKIGYEAFMMERWGVAARELSDALWANTGDLEAMQRVAFRFRQDATLRMRALTP